MTTTQTTEGGKTSTEESYTTDDGSVRVSISDRWCVPGEVHWLVSLTAAGAWPARPFAKIDLSGNATTWESAREAAKAATLRARRMEQTK